MNLSLKKMTCALFALTVFVGCAAGPTEDDGPTTSAEEQQPTTATSTEQAGASEANKSSVAQEAAQKLSDPTYTGVVYVGTAQGWSTSFDKKTNHVLMSHGDTSVNFDPKDLDDEAKLQELVKAGVPEGALLGWKSWACRAACWGAAAAGCAAVGATCAAGTVITIGGFALPCTVAIIAACGASGAGASVCSDWCTKKFD
jgi:hypothetical protein